MNRLISIMVLLFSFIGTAPIIFASDVPAEIPGARVAVYRPLQTSSDEDQTQFEKICFLKVMSRITVL